MNTPHQMTPRHLVSLDDLSASLLLSTQQREAPAQGSGIPGALARVGIGLPCHPLGDTAFVFQVGISTDTTNPNFIEWRERCPGLETTDGKVSGVVVFDEYKPIGHFTASVNHRRPMWSMGVDPAYRGMGIATLAILEWFKAAPFANLMPHPVNTFSARAILSAHIKYLRWANEQKMALPPNVLASIGAHSQPHP